MDLQIIDKRIDTRPLADRLTQGESNADECMIVSERFYGAIDLAALTWEIRGTVRDRNFSMSQVLTPEDSEDQLRIPWKIGPEFLTTSGTLRLTLVGSGANGDVVVKFNGDKLYIKPNDLSGFAPSTSPIEKMWAQMVAALETAKECAQQTASDAEAAKVSEKSAASSAAVALASEQSSATSKQAAESAAKEAKEAAQEAVGFRTMQGGAVLPTDGDIDLTQPYQTKTGGSLTVTSAEKRIDSVTVNGFTTQTGSGDPSPENIKPIENAGTRNNLMTVTGNTDGLFMSSVVPTRVAVLVSDAIANQELICDLYESNRVSQTDKTCYIDSNKNFGITDSRFKSLEEAKRILNEEPVTFAYKSTEDTGEHYTGIAVKRDGTYRCEIIRLADRLHAGDTLDTRVESEYDAYAEFDGSSDESWVLESGAATGQSGSKWLWIKFSGPQVRRTTDTEVPSAASNSLLADSSQNTYTAKSEDTFSLAYSSGNILQVRIAGIDTVEALKTHLQSHPLRVFYKSTSGGTSQPVKKEIHIKKTLVLTGTEEWNWEAISGGHRALIGIKNAVDTVTNIFCTDAKAGYTSSPGTVQTSTSTLFVRIARFDADEDATAFKAFLAERYSAGSPVTVEYQMAKPELYVDEPAQLENPQGTYTVSGESGSTCQALMKRLQDGGNATTLNGHSWDDIVSLISEMINSKGK